MIREWFWARTALAAPLARRLGYVRDHLQQKARWIRNTQAWQPHLDKSRAFIRDAIRQCERHELVVVAGSGLCLDIPLEELSATFKEVILVDLVHPREIVKLAEKLGNVRLHLGDLTGMLPAIAGALDGGPRLPIESMGGNGPEALAGELPKMACADLVISANTLAQLPLIPMERLWTTGLYRDEALESFASNLVAGHIAWLRSFACPSVLITDLAWISLGQENAQTTTPLYHADLGAPQGRWEWQVAPKPEAHPARDILHIVGAFSFPPQGK